MSIDYLNKRLDTKYIAMKKSKVLLDVPHVQQISANTSLAACAEMVLRHNGTELSQREIYQTAKSGDRGPATDVGISLAVKDLGYKVVSWWDENKNAPDGWADMMQNFYWPIYWRAVQLGVLEKKEDADLFLIKEMIDKGLPVIVEVDSGKLHNKKTSLNHAIVIKGYSRTHFTYNDPYLANGANKRMDLKKFEEIWVDTPFVNRSMFVILKNDRSV